MPRRMGNKGEKNSLKKNYYIKKYVRKSVGKKTESGALSHELLKGSLTLEAALVLPVFLLVMVMVLFLFEVMQTQYIVGNSLDQAVAETSLVRNISGKEAKNLTKASFYKELVAQDCYLPWIKNGIAGFSWKNTEVNDSYIDALVTYHIKFPIRFFGQKSIQLSDGCRMHRWTGRQNEDGKNANQEWVYVTLTGNVYHKSRECTHLKLSVQSIAAAKLKKQSKKYSPCGHCTKGGKMGAVVYITNDGDCYHFKIDCSGLKRTIYMILKEQVGNKRPCSRCGG